MRYVSPYHLLDYVNVNEDQFNIGHLERIQRDLLNIETKEKIQTLIPDYDIETLTESLSSIKSPTDLLYHRWIYNIPSLLAFFENGSIAKEASFSLSQEMRFSGNFIGFKNFISPWILERTTPKFEYIFSSKNFDGAGQLNSIISLTNISRQNPIFLLTSTFLKEEIAAFDNARVNNAFPSIDTIYYLQSPDFLAYLNNMPTELAYEKEKFLNAIRDCDRLFRKKDYQKIGLGIYQNLRQLDSQKFSQHFSKEIIVDKVVEKPKPAPKAAPKVSTESTYESEKRRFDEELKKIHANKNKPSKVSKSDNSGKYVLSVISILLVLISFIFKMSNRTTYNSSNDYNFDDLYGFDDEDDIFDFSDWSEHIEELKDYADDNKSDEEESVRSLEDYSDHKTYRSTPFIDFFYPLHNKEGYDGFRLVNNSDYAVVLMVKGEFDCYTYFMESKEVYGEDFSLETGDELIFYFGKEFKETDDLLFASKKGFRYVDDITSMYLDSVYVVLENEDADNEVVEYGYDDEGELIINSQIVINSKNGVPSILFDYKRPIVNKEDEDFL